MRKDKNEGVNIIGRMDHTIDHTYESANRIYDIDGICPAISTFCGGGQEHKIITEFAPKKEQVIAAMRGRDSDNPNKHTEQKLEVNKQNTSNCLTSVQKDNLVIEKESQILTTKRTEYGKMIRKAYENGEIKESRHNMTKLEPRTDGVCNTLTTVQKDNLVLIKQATKKGSIECEVGGCFDASYPESKTRRGRVQGGGNISPTITAQNQEIVRIEKSEQMLNDDSQHDTVISENCIQTKYRIRKLTPRECGRLMGVSDDDITKMASINSNTQLYKQFGNSIVVPVLEAIFRDLNISNVETWDDLHGNIIVD